MNFSIEHSILLLDFYSQFIFTFKIIFPQFIKSSDNSVLIYPSEDVTIYFKTENTLKNCRDDFYKI
jgi:hypothetical protein